MSNTENNYVTPHYFYVVQAASEEGMIEQLSIGFRQLSDAVEFRDSDYYKKEYAGAYIMCTFKEMQK